MDLTDKNIITPPPVEEGKRKKETKVIRKVVKDCEYCTHWINEQRELGYKKDYGFCNRINNDYDDEHSQIKVLIVNGHDIMEQRFLNEDETLKEYKYELATHKKFSCNLYENDSTRT